jgi:hypothetical protein
MITHFFGTHIQEYVDSFVLILIFIFFLHELFLSSLIIFGKKKIMLFPNRQFAWVIKLFSNKKYEFIKNRYYEQIKLYAYCYLFGCPIMILLFISQLQEIWNK